MLFFSSASPSGTTIFPSHDATLNGKDGEDISAADYHSRAWWTNPDNWDGGAWDESIWDIADGRLPTLRNMPQGAQNPRVE